MTERTLIIAKPDAVQRHLVGRIVTRLEEKGFKLVAAKFMRISEQTAREHYAVHKGKAFYENLVKFLSSYPVLIMVWQGHGVIGMTRRMMGATFGSDADPGTIRGDFSASRGFNLVHGSDSEESAQKEITLYFTEDEIVDYSFSDEAWLYGSND